MAVGSNVNPNFPIPGIDQSSKGFRDNFSTIKVEIEDLQAKNIVLIGDATGNAIIDGGTGDVIINTVVSVANVAAASPDRSVQFNDLGTLAGDSLLSWLPAYTLVVGPQAGDTYYWTDTGRTKVHDVLYVEGTYGAANISLQGNNGLSPTIALLSTESNGVGMANINVGNADGITIDTLNFSFNGNCVAQLNDMGLRLGNISALPGGGPSVVFQAYVDDASYMGRFDSSYDNSDNGVRLTTYGANSTSGLVLEQNAANWVGGLRIGQNGYVTLHAGLNNGSWLNDSSQMITLDTVGQVGIGIPSPQFRLDVDGAIQWTDPNVANVAPTSAGIVGVVVDSWDLSVYRSADYTVQVTDALGAIEITKLLVMHEAGAAYQYIYANLNSGGGGTGPTTLGTLTASPNGSMMELSYSGVANGNTVKVDATYIPL